MHLHPIEARDVGEPRVHGDDLLAPCGQRARRGLAGALEAHDEERAVGEPRPPHVMDCWYSVKAIALQIAATIQKRRMILVSDQAMSSK